MRRSAQTLEYWLASTLSNTLLQALTSTNTLHNLLPGLQALPPVVLPLEQVARMEGVCPQLEHTAELPRRAGRPEAELLHQTRALGVNERLKLAVEFGELGVVLDAVQRVVVAGVALVLPDVHKGVAVADFGPPRTYKVNLGAIQLAVYYAPPVFEYAPYSQACPPYAGTSCQPDPHTRPPCPV